MNRWYILRSSDNMALDAGIRLSSLGMSIVGRVARIHTQTRVVVSIPGVISYATTYIPKHQMEQVI